ncbi:polyphosphate kinase 2 [Chachezhania antarctica]|uniref:polyphosphate kinase 2 n=1 Tax=Chachezhania antarctica TaxID=2340860 RepID=UPI000EB52491|nr:polyphosphate kinase 2 [Chachezhania antarctica]|tara:strand:- start:4680 stop:5549 length:870 start_codon:yes stop_codon:yes gene_type:complete
MDLPFDGAITDYFENHAPKTVRREIEGAKKHRVMNPAYPYKKDMDSDAYHDALEALQVEAVKMQAWAKRTGQRIALLFEGRDAAGKGGNIKRFTEYLNPRGTRVAALPKPSQTEASQWYFQRYIAHLPAAGEIVFFDRSWYNRAVVEHVFGFCTADERERFFRQVLPLEEALVADGMHLFKFWITIGRAEQLARFLAREQDPLKQWKLSRIDVEGLAKWDAYSQAISEMFTRSHAALAPWTVVRGDDKRCARLATMRHVLMALEYDGKDETAIGAADPLICGGPELYDA